MGFLTGYSYNVLQMLLALLPLVAGTFFSGNQKWIMYGGAWKGPHAEQNVLDAGYTYILNLF